jgi:hypothetical protein
MLYAIISDVHANLEAVEACFREIERLKPDRIILLLYQAEIEKKHLDHLLLFHLM